jgi:hypothetical protein
MSNLYWKFSKNSWTALSNFSSSIDLTWKLSGNPSQIGSNISVGLSFVSERNDKDLSFFVLKEVKFFGEL